MGFNIMPSALDFIMHFMPAVCPMYALPHCGLHLVSEIPKVRIVHGLLKSLHGEQYTILTNNQGVSLHTYARPLTVQSVVGGQAMHCVL
jgi:hypothetical protein